MLEIGLSKNVIAELKMLTAVNIFSSAICIIAG